ncbi:hypothetical protein PF011_g19569 [Phytophthora fragariae]|uniref:Peptidase A2 domain-containing protein n=1 Tax=Phytophthora fragariae TaxID=53985 RepID=A0A6A3IWI6_9STRA|nr:hypothetical protein PF011_g19569 [Phytophthora fragariae]
MRALVNGAVDDTRIRILLDTGANVSVISASFAKKLRVREVFDHGRSLEVRGINPGIMETQRRALVKVTLGWKHAYEFEVWIMDHSAGVDVVLGMDFMVPAGIRLDLFHGTARLPDEDMVPLLKSKESEESVSYGNQVVGGPTELLAIPGREWREFRLPRRQPSRTTHEMWIRRSTRLRASCSAHEPVVLWVPKEELPRETGYARVASDKYREWQVLAYAESRDETLFGREGKLYQEWLAAQPSAVERHEYPTPRALLRRPTEASACNETPREDDGGRIATANCLDLAETADEAGECRPPSVDTELRPAGDGGQDSGPSEDYATEEIAERPESCNPVIGVRIDDSAHPPGESGEILTSMTMGGDSRGDQASGGEATEPRDDSEAEVTTDRAPTDPTDGRHVKSDAERLEAVFVSVMAGGSPESVADADWGTSDTAEHLPNEIELTDYAHELAFLPDLTEPSSTTLDYSGPNVQNTDLQTDQQAKLVAVLQQHEYIMIASGNALPPPAYGVVCDIDVQGHPPIKQKARRTPLRFLGKLYELLKGLLTARLVSFSDSPWASPIVIVLKKNGIDIRLCIDYKRVNAITAIMEYAIPLVDDLLTEMEAYLWFCSLDAASGFWAVMMTRRARKISAFVCALGHFEWLRMPFGLKNAPMIYQRMIDNALWGFVQPKGGWTNFSEKMRIAETTDAEDRAGVTGASVGPTEPPRTKFEADRALSTTESAVASLVNSPLADMYSSGEPDESSLVPVLDRRSFVDDICFGSETFEACLVTLDRLLSRFQECRISVSFSKSLFVQRKVGFLSHDVSAAGIAPDAKKAAAVTELSFPASKKGVQSFL